MKQIYPIFLRKILCVYKSTNLTGLYGEVGMVPLNIIRKVSMLRYWLKILNSHENSIIKRINIMLKSAVSHTIIKTGHIKSKQC